MAMMRRRRIGAVAEPTARERLAARADLYMRYDARHFRPIPQDPMTRDELRALVDRLRAANRSEGTFGEDDVDELRSIAGEASIALRYILEGEAAPAPVPTPERPERALWILEDARAGVKLNDRVAVLVRQKRTEAGLTQKDLADLVGTTQSVICRMEDPDFGGHGHTLTMLQRIADALYQKVTIQMEPQ